MLCLQHEERDDLAIAVLACVVGGLLALYFLLYGSVSSVEEMGDGASGLSREIFLGLNLTFVG